MPPPMQCRRLLLVEAVVPPLARGSRFGRRRRSSSTMARQYTREAHEVRAAAARTHVGAFEPNRFAGRGVEAGAAGSLMRQVVALISAGPAKLSCIQANTY